MADLLPWVSAGDNRPVTVLPMELTNSIRRMSPYLKRCLWLVLVYLSVRGVDQYARRPLWTCELPPADKLELAGWINDDQFAMAFGKWDEKQGLRVWNKLAVYDQATGLSVAEYDLPNWKYGAPRVQGERIVCDEELYGELPFYDLVTRRAGREPSDRRYDEVSPSGRWRLRGFEYGPCRIQDGNGPWQPWPTQEQLATWKLTENSYRAPADSVFAQFRGLKFSPDETRVATVCEQRTAESNLWVGRIHAWPSGEILHEWRLGKSQGNYQFAMPSIAWEGDTFFVEEVVAKIGDGNVDDTINRWFRCQVRATGVEMTVLDWTDWDKPGFEGNGSRWLEASGGDCLETYYYSKRFLPFPSWGWNYRITRWIYNTFNPLLHDQSPLLRETETGQVLWQGPRQGFGRWQISRDRQFALGLPVQFPQGRDPRTLALYPLTPRPPWPWYAALALVAVWGWRSLGRDRSPAASPIS